MAQTQLLGCRRTPTLAGINCFRTGAAFGKRLTLRGGGLGEGGGARGVPLCALRLEPKPADWSADGQKLHFVSSSKFLVAMRGRCVAQYQTFVRFELPKDELRVLMATGLMQGFRSLKSVD